MSGTASLEIRRDFIGEHLYASRNYNQLRHLYQAPDASRHQLDWNLTLRQVRVKKQQLLKGPSSMPNLHAGEVGVSRNREPLVPEHGDGPYHCESETTGKYQNFANTSHMVQGRVRVSSGAAHGVDWQLNLRDGLHRADGAGQWRRHCTKSQPSFDVMKENCGSENEAYRKAHTTPLDRRPDRRVGGIPIATIRDDPICFKRWAGCEGTHVGQWQHLIEDRSRGYKSRRAIQQETTMRERPGDTSGSRITDNRTEGCIVEMLGKKKWVNHTSRDPLAARPPDGDAKLHHLSRLRIMPEADEENRQLRMSKHPRTDADLPGTHGA